MRGKWEMFSVGLGICQEYWITWKLRKEHSKDMEYGVKNEKRGKWETHTIGYEIWLETLKNMKNEKCTLWDLEYGEKIGKWHTMRNSHNRTWNMARNIEKGRKWAQNTVWPRIWQETQKNVKREKCTL